MCILHRVKNKSKIHGKKTFVVETMFNILSKNIFYKDIAKVSSFPFLRITTKSTHFLPVKRKIPIQWIELQINKIQKVSKPYI